MTGDRHSHCSWCGARFVPGTPWPRRCAVCRNTSFLNPLPVAVLLQPVDRGVLVIRRTDGPQAGALALPGGFIDHGEDWRTAAARELREEAAVRIEPSAVSLFDVRSAADGILLVFGLGSPIRASALPPFEPTGETSERRVITEPTELAFPLHTEAVARYFRAR